MTAVAIQGTFKKDQTQWDGLADHVEDMIKNPHSPIIIVAICEVVEIKDRPQEGTHQPKIRIKQIERATEGDAIRVTEMLNRVYNARTGRTDSQPTLFDDVPAIGAAEHPGDWPGADGPTEYPGIDPQQDAREAAAGGWANDGEQQPQVQESTGWRDEATGLTSGGLVTDDAPAVASEQPVEVKPRRGRPRKAAPLAQFNPGDRQGIDEQNIANEQASPDVGDKATGGFITAPGAPDLGDDPDGDNTPWPGDVDHPGTADEG